jgi:hypothetical protein
MMVVVFRAHRTEVGLGDEYLTALKQMALAAKMPGYVSPKAYVAYVGERLDVDRMGVGRDPARLGAPPRARPDQRARARAVL